MKKRVVGLLLALAMSVSITACSEAEKEIDTGVSESTQETSEKETKEGDIVDPDPVEAGEAAILSNGYYSHVYYGVDSKGNKVSEYRWDEIKEKLQGRDFSSAYVSVVGDGLFCFYVYDDLGDHWGYKVYVADAKSAEVRELWTSPANCWLDNVDVWQGKIYLTIGKNDNVKEEHVFAKDENGFQFHEETSPSSQVLQKLAEYNLTARSTKIGYRYGNCSVTRALAETGFVIGYKDEKYYQFDANGNVSEIAGMPEEYFYLEYYDKNGIAFSESDYYAGTSVLRVLNLKTGTLKTVTELTDSSILAYEDGKVYYKEPADDGFVMKKNRVSVYDVTTGQNKALYEAQAIPGATDLEPGTYDFQVVDGKIYYVTLVGDKVEWVKYDPQSGDVRETGFVVGEKSVYKYGTVIYDTYVNYCDFCDIPLEKDFQEVFQLDSKYSAYADKINESLRKDLEWVVNDRANSVEETADNCEDHKAAPTIWCETDEAEVYSVRIFSGRYLAVDYQGYWYGGGVHGMPSTGQRLYDLNTGEAMTLADFYNGSKEDYKKLVAQKTKEDFLSYDEGSSPYFAQDAQSVYDQAYQYADMMNGGNVFFEENGISVVYPPYDMGPYASGFIEVFISYQELLGRPEL